MLTLSSCDDDESKKSSLRYTGYIPNFSVNAPKNSIAGSSSMLKSAGNKALNLEQEVTSGSRIDCSEQLANWNAISLDSTYQLPRGNYDDNSPDCVAPMNVFCKRKRIGMILNLYTQSQFYDCNARQQLQEDGLTKRCVLRVGEAGTNSIGADDLCSQRGLDSVEVQLLYTYKKDDVDPDDDTRFVSWTMNPITPSTEDIEGLMINKYRKENEPLRARTRVNLNRSGGFKTIDSTQATHDGASDELLHIIRAHFKEVGDSNKIVTDNYIVGRIWEKDYGKVLAIRAHLRAGSGSSVFYKSCTVPNEEAARTSTCDVDNSSTGTFFDSNGTLVSNAPANVNTAWDNSNFNAPNGDHFASFFNNSTTTNTTVRDYFNPDSFSPGNTSE